jgi:hypothetical protein
MRESNYKDKGDVREKKETMKPPFKKRKKKKRNVNVELFQTL